MWRIERTPTRIFTLSLYTKILILISGYSAYNGRQWVRAAAFFSILRNYTLFPIALHIVWVPNRICFDERFCTLSFRCGNGLVAPILKSVSENNSIIFSKEICGIRNMCGN